MYVVSEGTVNFTSDAPLEMIKAKSDKLQGVLKISDRSFAFRVPMKSFQGFNSSLQQTHFNENYLETGKYPYTIFEGKIIEDINLTTPGKYQIRGKGRFVCHGVEKERIIRTTLTVSSSGRISIASDFTVLLIEHNIKIPSVVSQKIAEEIDVHVEMQLKPRK
jgi:hypothetical protein